MKIVNALITTKVAKGNATELAYFYSLAMQLKLVKTKSKSRSVLILAYNNSAKAVEFIVRAKYSDASYLAMLEAIKQLIVEGRTDHISELFDKEIGAKVTFHL